LNPPAIHQFIPSLAGRDAIGAHTLHVQDLLRELGYRSEIFVGDALPDVRRRSRPYRQYERDRHRGRAWLLYQSSIGSPIADFLADRQEPKVVNFHNITPARLLEGWDPDVAEGVATGRRQLVRLAPHTTAAIAVSRFNEQDLISAGYRSTTVVPPLIDLESFDSDVDREAMERLGAARAEGGADLLFVGRILPHKAQHDVIKALAAYRQVYDPRARLHLVGGVSSRSYRRALIQFVAELGLEDAVDLAGSVTQAELAAYYRTADVFVCCSDHEGFCIPLLEAMHHGIPVVSYAAGAVPETIDGAGLVLEDKAAGEMAAAIDRVVRDPALRKVLVEAGLRRLEDFRLERTRERFADAIRAAVSAS
jgi:glycosyltransferase involved in cell wall biosynthesis